MMKSVLVFGLVSLSFAALAEEKTCAVKGLHCPDCVADVQKKVCEAGQYAVCDVKLTDKKQELGQIHLKTKDAKAKIDETAMGKLLADMTYEMQKCKALN